MIPVTRPAGAARTTQVAIVALPPVSMSGVGPIVDALNLANEIEGRLLYRWQVCSWDGRPVPLAGGAQWHADAAFNDAIACDWLIVISERFQQFADYRLFLASLARVGQRTPLVTGIHHGVWWLAMAGQLQGYRVAVNWEMYQQFAEQLLAHRGRLGFPVELDVALAVKFDDAGVVADEGGDDFLQSIGDVVAVYRRRFSARAAFSLAGRSASLCCRI